MINTQSLDIQIIEGPLDELKKLLLNGGIEIALLYDLDLESGFKKQPLAKVKPHLLLSASHPLANESVVSLRSLQNDPFILLDLPHSRDYFLGFFSKIGIQPYIKHRSQSFELVRGLVANGKGYSILNLQPASQKTYDGGEVRCVPIPGESGSPFSCVGLSRRSSADSTGRRFQPAAAKHFSSIRFSG
jgi:DNA-binding transcriptional LysR family regulator